MLPIALLVLSAAAFAVTGHRVLPAGGGNLRGACVQQMTCHREQVAEAFLA